MALIYKYTIIYCYLAIVMGLALAISKITKSNEYSRNLIHICAGWGWIFYKILLPASIHAVYISASFVLLTLITVYLKLGFVERKDGSHGTIFFTLSMLVMSIAGYKDFRLFDSFGVAMICLSSGDAAANIIGSKVGKTKIYQGKSLQGTLACVLVSGASLALLEACFNLGLDPVTIFILSVLCALTELFSGRYDNLAIPLVVFLTSAILFSYGPDSVFLTSMSVGVIMALLTVKLKLLTIPASYMLFFMIFLLFYAGGWPSFITLLSIFAIIIICEKVLKSKTDVVFRDINKEHGLRNERQLLHNCLFPVISIFLFRATHQEAFYVAYVATIAETIGDSVASSVGVLSKGDPYDICTLKRVQRGLSGAVSPVGTGSSLIVCLYSGFIYMLVRGFTPASFISIFIASFFGVMLDSVLGSTLQVQYRCTVCDHFTEKERHCNSTTVRTKGIKFLDNSRVNFICNAATFLASLMLMYAR